jgi:hypothetical protein
MQSIRKSLLPAVLVAALATSLPALASDHEDGPRGRVGKSPIARFVNFVIHALDEFSFPPPH